MDRRLFLKLTAAAAAAGALQPALPVAARALPGPAVEPLRAPGTYRISGRVRLREPLVEISGITNAQQITWSGAAAAGWASFSSFEHFDEPWRLPRIRVRGGQLGAVAVVPIELG
jgi:hypothetical protein